MNLEIQIHPELQNSDFRPNHVQDRKMAFTQTVRSQGRNKHTYVKNPLIHPAQNHEERKMPRHENQKHQHIIHRFIPFCGKTSNAKRRPQRKYLQFSRLHGNRNAHCDDASECKDRVATPVLGVTPPPSGRGPYLRGVIMRAGISSSSHGYVDGYFLLAPFLFLHPLQQC